MEKMDVDDDTVIDLSASSRPARRDASGDGTLDLSKPSNNAPVVVPLPLQLPLQLSGLPLTVQAVTNSPRSTASSPSLGTASVTPTAAPAVAPPSEPGTMEPPASRSLLRRDLDSQYPSRRSLRPRLEPRNYVESPDVIVLSDEEPKLNGFTNGYESDSSDIGEMPPLLPIKELSPAEVEERERMLRKLREELRNEEMKLVLLKKLRQSQQMKENIAVPPTSGLSQTTVTPTGPPPAGTKVLPGMVKPTTSTLGPGTTIDRLPAAAHSQSHMNTTQAHSLSRNHHKQPAPNVPLPVNRGVPPPRSSLPPPLLSNRPSTTPILPPNTTLTPTNMSRGGSNQHSGRSGHGGVNYAVNDRLSKDHHSPVVTPQPLLGSEKSVSTQSQEQDRSRVDDNQTPAQRQAAAKLALRKQLEKTLLQIPPPKPPPPEMHFIPNPSNTDFVYLLGLEHVVDFITKDNKTPLPPEPFRCSQCSTNFTPVWKWEKSSSKGKEPKVICESCVTTNVKKALKAEHTNRLKTAFVKALQQEQEIEQRLAQSSSASPQPDSHHTSSHASSHSTSHSASHTTSHSASHSSSHTSSHSSSHTSHSSHSASHTPSPASKPVAQSLPPSRHVPTPPSNNNTPRTPPLSKLAQENSKYSSHQQAAAAAALQQQLLRGIGGVGGLSQHQLSAQMLQFTLYQYQLAMAQAQAASAAGGKGSAAAAANLAEFQRQAEALQRQYLMEMIPPAAASPSSRHSNHHSAHSMNNWKT
ncbi:transcriptional repressor p66-alpha isoform X1 [Frankliniella occidentalis]|uniref:Transcriptional repressor p66-alpha isoform X1 n=1 Tax=Frankliniella occidentalis TaxID=133901 RepID=A0A6J1T3X6_FRAOC|nr:transcriptional repressor p66-alpha isoform X1 [Frankliniella occidentalis]XP_026288284.1 transcriptional repressor p66-alpha isoform X1 [Frankliniella occidentalis]XP_026288285.1 transcriptional repressor p66-alpha isoform X1 [Frankliniella occidentalis]XP_026288286.1 transcriptional repressor p66-alpha isoform X1 [Frankliniella occidentalis]XP_026288287.1 transcriptional repressor p66-alpha isoform X1 [Frankliniella occidentalis]XP_052128740.1 transcriptional repressor p66-alpha isoform X